ncbi:E2 [Canis familiaris papillomavirus 11]|uniref:Regulatory protein E2 n=1 Tax=Canis familiaris papillomavirus 11 TaxID=1091166 RepID=G4XF79_9PAPI|nr:E2 [Canis familiaris papillomavirus 11]
MENLKKRLDAIQDALLTIYEEGSDRLTDQVQHWSLLRRENVLLHFAKKSGVLRLGLQPVPALRVSADRAKQAIEMQLTLQTLQESQYADEQWTMQDTSRERWMAEPAQCFKKGATYVEVYFDGNRSNSMQYTMWHHVYYTDCNDQWQKTRSHVGYDGLWFWDNCHRRYYVRFDDEARKYGTTGQWAVIVNNEPISPLDSVTSTTQTTNPGTKTTGTANGDPGRLAGEFGTAGPSRPRDWRAPVSACAQAADSTDTQPFAAPASTQEEEEPSSSEETPELGRESPVTGSLRTNTTPWQSCGDPGGILVPEHTGLTTDPEPLPVPAEPLPRSISPALCSRLPETLQAPVAPESGPGSAPAAPNAAPLAQPEAHPARAEAGPGEGVAPGGQGRLPAARRYRRRSRHILREAGDCTSSLIVLSGPCNTLKCLRYRVKQLCKGLFSMISTTWYWAGEGPERLGNARIIITFASNSQRAEFMDRMRLPSSVTLLDSIHAI